MLSAQDTQALRRCPEDHPPPNALSTTTCYPLLKLQESSDQEISGLRSQIRALKTALEAAHAEAAEAQDHAAICLPPAAVSALQESVTTAEAALDEARRRIKELEGFLKEANAVAGTMTPRPSFRELKKYGVEDAAAAAAAANTGSKGGRIRTQELVDAAAARLAVYAASRNAARAAAELGDAVLAPEPAPAEVTLAVTTDTSACGCAHIWLRVCALLLLLGAVMLDAGAIQYIQCPRVYGEACMSSPCQRVACHTEAPPLHCLMPCRLHY